MRVISASWFSDGMVSGIDLSTTIIERLSISWQRGCSYSCLCFLIPRIGFVFGPAKNVQTMPLFYMASRIEKHILKLTSSMVADLHIDVKCLPSAIQTLSLCPVFGSIMSKVQALPRSRCRGGRYASIFCSYTASSVAYYDGCMFIGKMLVKLSWWY
jgi:hypothetical protein